jgi:hypothetical protein
MVSVRDDIFHIPMHISFWLSETETLEQRNKSCWQSELARRQSSKELKKSFNLYAKVINELELQDIAMGIAGM